MNDDQLKKLAKKTIQNGRVNKKIKKFVLSRLSRTDTLAYLSWLKKVAYENSVRVISSEELPIRMRRLIQAKFQSKNLFFETDRSIGPGIKIILDDSILDFTIDGYLARALEQLKN